MSEVGAAKNAEVVFLRSGAASWLVRHETLPDNLGLMTFSDIPTISQELH